MNRSKMVDPGVSIAARRRQQEDLETGKFRHFGRKRPKNSLVAVCLAAERTVDLSGPLRPSAVTAGDVSGEWPSEGSQQDRVLTSY
jgi:hypothetical protein